jgi:integrase
MANAARRPDGRWRGRYRGPDGKERTKAFATKRDALDWANREESKVRTQSWTDPNRAKISLGELAPSWFDGLDVKPKTYAAYESLYRTCIKPTWGTTRIDRIQVSAVRTWVSKMTGARGKKISESRRRQAYVVLCGILDLAVEDGRLPRNPARPRNGEGKRANFLPRLPPPRKHRYLTHEELSRLAKACGAYETMVLTLGYTGLRWGEAAALRVSSVDLLRGRLTVDQSVAEISGKLYYGTTKTHANRQIPVPAFLRADLERAMADKGPSDLLFTSPEGGPLRLTNWRQRFFDKAAKAENLVGITPHGLRHTAASLAVASGANVKAVQRMLGHKDAAMTLNTYTDLFDDELDAVADRLDEAFSRARADLLRTGTDVASVTELSKER